MNLSPINNKTAQEIQSEIWNVLWKKYRYTSNASSDKDKHFSDDLWKQVIHDADAIYEKYPCEFTSNLLSAYIDELQARDLGSYPDKYSGAHQALTEKKHDLQEDLEEKEGFV